MNRGSVDGLLHAEVMVLASMRPRFMNRGSATFDELGTHHGKLQ